MDLTNAVPTNDTQDPDITGSPLSPVFSDPSPGQSTKNNPRLAGRAPSTHTLLAANDGADVRRSAHIETTTAIPARANISMPPPLGKPSTDRRLSVSLTTARLARRSEDGTSATSPPSSVKSSDDRQQFGTSPQLTTTATDTTSITTNSLNNLSGLPVLSPPLPSATLPNDSPLVQTQPAKMSAFTDNAKSPPLPARTESVAPAGLAVFSVPKSEGPASDSGALPARGPRGTTSRTTSTHRRLSRTTSKENSIEETGPRIGKVGVCALDVKARSRPSRQILTRLQNNDDFEVIVFGDKVILDEGMCLVLPCMPMLTLFRGRKLASVVCMSSKFKLSC